MKYFYLKLAALAVILFSLSACGIKDKKTTVEISDPDRHYFPIIRGQELDIVYEIKNIGKYPLFISDIHTSCGCMLIDESSFKVLPSGGKGFIRLKYNSSKNIGYVKHYIKLYANLDTLDKLEMTFDLNVVTNSLYTEDYEELHRETMKEKKSVDGNENNLGYYTDNLPFE